ncbi:MAG: glutamate--cysteine ligase [Candidatus Marinimicrobia bacterium]|nr:glutamate--cysteine ligase [Candidatus Neomarinimicrobiota bacterium]
MALVFQGSPEPTLGVEVELQIVDIESRKLVSKGPEILKHFKDDINIKPELLQSTIEINTGICRNVKEVKRDLTNLMSRLLPISDDMGCAFISAGTHPTATWPEQDITDIARYKNLIDRVQWPAQRLMIFGLHVHVGINSPEKAIAVFNSLTTYIPHFLAISASSPFWQSYDTGLASVRAKVFETLPTAGLPYRMLNWAEFQRFMKTLVAANAIETVREVWWDIRPHPGFGTVELRMCDGIPTMSELLSIVALAHCTVVWLSEQYDEGNYLPLHRHWVVRENKWRASRWSLEGQIIIDEEGNQKTISEEIRDFLEILQPVSVKLGCQQELQDVRGILKRGPSYKRQRNIYNKTGNFNAVVDALVEEWRNDCIVESV